MLELQNQLLCIREQTPPREQTAAWLPGSPSSRGYRQREQSPGCLGTAATSPGWFAGLGAAGKGKAEPGRAWLSPAAPAMQSAWQEASVKVLEPEQRGRTVPFPLGSWLRTHQLSCGCQTGREGEEEHQLTARGARSPHVPVCVRCRSHPRTAAGAGRRRRKAGRKGRSTRQPGCSSLLRPLHNFWIFSAITMGFSLRIFSAASAL